MPGRKNHLARRRVQDTLEFHWGKHHRGYVTTLNGQIKDKPLDSKSLDEVLNE